MAWFRSKQHKNEIIENEWTTLRSLWDGCKANLPDETRAEIDGLFPKGPKWSSMPEDWYALNLAEQRVGAHLDATQLSAEYQCLLDIARERKLTFLDRYQEKAKLFSTPVPAGTTLDEQRSVYLTFLQKLQSDFIETRFRRQLRRETATRLFYFGLIVICLAAAPLGFYLYHVSGQPLIPGSIAQGHQLFSSEPVFGLTLVAGFGLLGAYFSRAMSFQSRLAMVNFEDITNLYQWRMLLLRLLYGAIGAVILYFLLRGRLLGGSVFPDLSQISIGEQPVWKAGKDGVALVKDNGGGYEPAGLTILAPTADLAKLLVWSFIAGFSERLVPDTLERTEAQAKQSDTK
jgi:hypothetical protein